MTKKKRRYICFTPGCRKIIKRGARYCKQHARAIEVVRDPGSRVA